MEWVRNGTPPWAPTRTSSDKVARTTPSMERILEEEVQWYSTSPPPMCWCLLVQPMHSTSSSEAMCHAWLPWIPTTPFSLYFPLQLSQEHKHPSMILGGSWPVSLLQPLTPYPTYPDHMMLQLVAVVVVNDPIDLDSFSHSCLLLPLLSFLVIIMYFNFYPRKTSNDHTMTRERAYL